MKILVEKHDIEKIEVGDIVQTEKGISMKICAGYLSLEGDSFGMVYHVSDVTNCKLLVKSEDVVISKAEKEEVYEVKKVEEIEDDDVEIYKTKDNSVTIYKDGLFLSKDFIKFIGKITGNNVKEIFKLGDFDDSFMQDCLNDLLYHVYSIYHNHRDKIDDDEFMVDELKDMIYNFLDYHNKGVENLYNERTKRTDETLLDCINYYKNVKKEDLLNVYCNISLKQYFGSLDEITYYFNKIGRLIEIGRTEYLNDN